MRVFRHPGGRQAPIFRQESEGGIRRRMRKWPGGKSGWRWCLGMEPSGRAAGTYGARFDGSHRGLGNGGCCEVGEPAGELFDAAARDDQHEYFDKSLLEVGHGICRAAPGAPPQLKTPKSGGWDRPGFVVASPCLASGIFGSGSGIECRTDKTEAFPTPCGSPGDGIRVAVPGQTQ